MWSKVGTKEKVMVVIGFIFLLFGVFNKYTFGLSKSVELLIMAIGSMMILLVWVSYAKKIKRLKE